MEIVFCQDVNCEDFRHNILYAYHAAFEVWCGVLGGEEGDKSHGDGQVPLQIQRVVWSVRNVGNRICSVCMSDQCLIFEKEHRRTIP